MVKTSILHIRIFHVTTGKDACQQFDSVVSPGQMTKTNNPRHRLVSDAPPLEFRWEPADTPLVTAWTIAKKEHRAVCTIHAHPLGVEVRLDLDDELHRSEVIRCARPVRELPDGCADICCGLAEQIARAWMLPIFVEQAKPNHKTTPN